MSKRHTPQVAPQSAAEVNQQEASGPPIRHLFLDWRCIVIMRSFNGDVPAVLYGSQYSHVTSPGACAYSLQALIGR